MSKRKPKSIPVVAGEPCCSLAAMIPPRFFQALGDPNRIAILARLVECGRSCTVGEMAACCPVDLSVVSRHLAKLRDAGIVEAEKRGKEVYYSVRAGAVLETLEALAGAIRRCCPGTVGRNRS